MMAIGCYFAFIIIVMGTISAVCDFIVEDRELFSQGILHAHNNYRRMHDSPELKLNPELSEIADKRVKEWEAQLPKTLSDEYGANYSQMFFGDKSKLEPKTIVAVWYKDQILYDYTNERNSERTHSFTQVVWKSTLEIGVGIMKNNGVVSVVVIYSPAGNQPGKFKSNVNRPQEVSPEDKHILDDILTFM